MAGKFSRLIVALLVVVPVVAGCGGRVVGGATNGVENKTAPQVQQAAIAELKAAGSVHIVGTAPMDAGPSLRFDLRIQGTSSTGTVTFSGADVAVTTIGDTVYLKADAAGWKAMGAPEAAPVFAGRWVKTASDTTGPDQMFTIDVLVVALDQIEVGMRPAVDQTDLNGAEAVMITYRNGDKLYVANTGKPWPLRLRSASNGYFDFSEHGTDFRITAPADAIDTMQP